MFVSFFFFFFLLPSQFFHPSRHRTFRFLVNHSYCLFSVISTFLYSHCLIDNMGNVATRKRPGCHHDVRNEENEEEDGPARKKLRIGETRTENEYQKV
ncbi:hypothetical protein CRE_20276 [Caenorhabditis remanei]|uniref:Secreted protein n=1 Tax=Caenorhabditis remanei TaxID=31234 RepID=E3MCH8_CAERE|nr:hypothetical protein CRE_20276 [Caenorhabditis remanei]